MNAIEKRELAAQHMLAIRRRAKRAEIGPTIAKTLPLVFQYSQKVGAAMAGPPMCRYIAAGPGMVTLQIGFAIAAAVEGEGEVECVTLPAGPAAVMVHLGPYDGLQQAYAEMEVWIEDNGLQPAAPPWEVYMNDPGDFPDPKDWRTDIYWPVN